MFKCDSSVVNLGKLVVDYMQGYGLSINQVEISETKSKLLFDKNVDQKERLAQTYIVVCTLLLTCGQNANVLDLSSLVFWFL